MTVPELPAMSAAPRTPGQVAREAWWAQSQDRLTMNPEGWDGVAAAVLAHSAAQRTARDEVTVDRWDARIVLALAGTVCDEDDEEAINRFADNLDAQESPND